MATKRLGKPSSVAVTTYDVGFGDCFLLSVHYSTDIRHVLIDFGSMSAPESKQATGKYMEVIARKIAADCNGKLHAVVATHRHKDHVSGFSSADKGPGKIIRDLKPDVVVRPWTEDPDLARDAIAPAAKRRSTRAKTVGHVRTLAQMHATAEDVYSSALRLANSGVDKQLLARVSAVAEDNISNRAAVENLRTMARNHYAHYGSKSGLEQVLPGVTVRVLGPPTIEQTDTILKQRQTDPDEFWLSRSAFWGTQARLARTEEGNDTLDIFAGHISRKPRLDSRWFRYKARQERLESMLSIVRILDDAMNNTSLILLFEVGNRKLLFPGDAQYENWMFALSKPSVLKRLAGTDLYKVGHHGSLNATPRTLWDALERKGKKGAANRLTSILSTKDHVHGHEDRETEVPRRPLIQALRLQSALTDTRKFAPDELSKTVTLTV